MECGFLRAAHLHEKPLEVDQASVPNADIQVSEEFLQAHQWLMIRLGSAAMAGAKNMPGITDADFRTAFEALIRTHRGEQVNPQQSAVFQEVQASLAECQDLSETTALGMLAFLQGLEYEYNNGRRLSRAFYDFLSQFDVVSA